MASPNWDALSVQHSKDIGDAVAAAATDGSSWTSAQRDFHLNQACRRWLDYRILAGKQSNNWYPLKDYIQENSVALVASVKTTSSWTGGIAYPLGVYNTTDAVIVLHAPQDIEEFIANSINQYLTPTSALQYYTFDGSQIRLLGGTATSSLKIRYVQQHAALSSGGASDILVPSEYWNEIIDLADAAALDERADQISVQRAAILRQKVEGLVGISNA